MYGKSEWEGALPTANYYLPSHERRTTIEIEINTQRKQGTQIVPFANLLIFVQSLIQSFKNSKKAHMWLRVQLSCQEPSTINFYKSLALVVILSCWPAWRAVVSTGHNESEHCNHMVEGFEWDWLQKMRGGEDSGIKDRNAPQEADFHIFYPGNEAE